MPPPQRILALLLRITGAVMMLALFPMVMPDAWIDGTHRWLGLGPLPSGPIIGYMARSLSFCYAQLGLFLVFVSFDVARYRPLVVLAAWLSLVGGVILLAIDLHVGLPGWWTWTEGPPIAALGVVLLALLRRTRSV